MALTTTMSGDWTTITGNKRRNLATTAFDASYPTGGESLTPRDLGLAVIDDLEARSDAGYIFKYNKSTQKLMAYHADYDAGADGALIEVGNGDNLSGVTDVTIIATGV